MAASAPYLEDARERRDDIYFAQVVVGLKNMYSEEQFFSRSDFSRGCHRRCKGNIEDLSSRHMLRRKFPRVGKKSYSPKKENIIHSLIKTFGFVSKRMISKDWL